jgi:type II secretory pathway component PulM
MKTLTHREQLLAIATAIAVATAVFFAFAIKPAIERTNTLSRVLPEKQRALQQLRTKGKQYAALRSNLTGSNSSESLQTEPLTILETITAQSGTAKNVAYMKKQSLQVDSKYSQTVTELRFEHITLNQLVDFLFQAQSSKSSLQIKSLYIEKNRTDRNLLDCVLQISTLNTNQTT